MYKELKSKLRTTFRKGDIVLDQITDKNIIFQEYQSNDISVVLDESGIYALDTKDLRHASGFNYGHEAIDESTECLVQSGDIRWYETIYHVYEGVNTISGEWIYKIIEDGNTWIRSERGVLEQYRHHNLRRLLISVK